MAPLLRNVEWNFKGTVGYYKCLAPFRWGIDNKLSKNGIRSNWITNCAVKLDIGVDANRLKINKCVRRGKGIIDTQNLYLGFAAAILIAFIVATWCIAFVFAATFFNRFMVLAARFLNQYRGRYCIFAAANMVIYAKANNCKNQLKGNK